MLSSRTLALAARLATAALLATALLAPSIATADAHLDASDPADGEEVPGPFAGPITLTFSETLQSGSHAELVDATDARVADAAVAGDRMTFTLATPLAPGSYSVKWTSVAADKHVARGTFGFTVLDPTPAPATPTPPPTAAPTAPTVAPTEAPAATPQTSAPTPAATAPPSPSQDDAGAMDVLIPIVAAFALVVSAGAWLLRRRPAG